MRTYFENINADFTCKHCGAVVSTRQGLSGVVNRNHCPYCLHSRHLDLFEAGDRLSACKALMAPVGLTLKKSRDKYAKQSGGELMLVHLCSGCERISINRIAADDDPKKVLEMFEKGLGEMRGFIMRCERENIHILQTGDRWVVHSRLFGSDFIERKEEMEILMTI